MAEVDTMMLSQEHSNIRREAVEHTNEIIKEGLKGGFNTVSTIVSEKNDLSKQIEAGHDRLTNDLFTLGRESADNRAQIMALGFQVRDGNVALAKDIELNALKTQMETAKQTTYLSDKIDGQAEATRALINELKYGDLNRALIERNSELVEERHAHRHWRHAADQSQWAAVNSQLQAFQSQIASSSQGMVNFGTQAGVGQTSSANQVR